MQIVYEPHPVSPDRKAELRGFKIIDARFKPADEVDIAPPIVAIPVDFPIVTPKRGRPRKSD